MTLLLIPVSKLLLILLGIVIARLKRWLRPQCNRLGLSCGGVQLCFEFADLTFFFPIRFTQLTHPLRRTSFFLLRWRFLTYRNDNIIFTFAFIIRDGIGLIIGFVIGFGVDLDSFERVVVLQFCRVHTLPRQTHPNCVVGGTTLACGCNAAPIFSAVSIAALR